MTCACCGDEKRTVALAARDDVEVCRDCLESLLSRVGVTSTPTLPVVDLPEAVTFYERAGFGVRVHHDEHGEPGEGFAFVDADGQSVFDLDAAPGMDPARNRAGCYLVTEDADAWHRRMVEVGVPVTKIANEPWGMREFTLTDPSGNRVRIGRSAPDSA